MKLSKIMALGLAVALSAACDKEAAKPKADGATNAATNSAKTETPTEAPKTDASDLPMEATGPVAKVNGVEITAAEYNEEVRRLNDMMGKMAPPGMLVGMKDRVVDQLIDRKLLEAEIQKRAIKVDDAEVSTEYAKLTKQLDDAAPGGTKAYLEKIGRTDAQMKDDIRKSLEFKKLMSDGNDVAVSEEDVKAFYEENKAQFDQPERVKASHILLKLEKDAPADKVGEVEKRAKDVAGKAKAAGADFAALAREFSEGPTAPRGGDLGYFVKGQMVPEFDEAAWKMKVGDISEPVRTQFGYHIIKIDDRQEAKSMPYDDAKSLIEMKLQEPKLRAAMTKTLDAIKANASIERMGANIKTNVAAPSMPPGMMGGGHPPMTPPPAGGSPPPGGNAPPSGEVPKLKLDTIK